MSTKEQRTVNVIVAGSGPAGLLVTSLLLQRNEKLALEEEGDGGDSSSLRYHITIVDGLVDLGKLDPDKELKENYRSWMLGLADHGLDALREIPKLYNDYVKSVGILLESLSLHIGKKEIKAPFPNDVENYIVDRNFIVAAIARYLHDNYQDSPFLTNKYEHKVQYVDHEKQRVLIRSNSDGSEVYQDYDLLLGCDGIRSVVREALIKTITGFEVDVGDIFQKFKAVHVNCPKDVNPSSMHILTASLPNIVGIALPETGNMLNLSLGVSRNLFEKLAPELKSDNPQIIADYMEANFKAFRLDDYMDFAKQWAGQRWNQTGQVHCNTYHSQSLKIAIMGDAAHATSPSIGMGMNQALRDAQVFMRLLGEHEDDLNKTLQSYSEERVKEGNSLTDLAMHLSCLDPMYQNIETFRMVMRGIVSPFIPSLVSAHPLALIGLRTYSLSDVYDLSVRLGIMGRHRRVNAKIRQDYFEREIGMIKEYEASSKIWMAGFIGLAIALFIGYFHR